MNKEMFREIVRLKRNALMLLGLLAAACVILWGYASLKQKPALQRAQSTLDQAKAAAAGSAVGTPASRYHAAQRDLQLFRDRVLDKRSFPAFLGQLFDTAQRNSLSFKQVTYKPTVLADQGLLSYAIGFNVSGKYASVKSFIADLARYREMVTLDSVSLANPSPTEERIDLRVQITAYLKEGT